MLKIKFISALLLFCLCFALPAYSQSSSIVEELKATLIKYESYTQALKQKIIILETQLKESQQLSGILEQKLQDELKVSNQMLKNLGDQSALVSQQLSEYQAILKESSKQMQNLVKSLENYQKASEIKLTVAFVIVGGILVYLVLK